MTIKEAILSFPGLSDVSDNFIEKILTDRSLTGSASYTSSDKENVGLCAADLYVMVANAPDFSEGRLSVTMQRGEMIRSAKRLYRNNGESENADKLDITVDAKSSWW
jgi:hypothetical protein